MTHIRINRDQTDLRNTDRLDNNHAFTDLKTINRIQTNGPLDHQHRPLNTGLTCRARHPSIGPLRAAHLETTRPSASIGLGKRNCGHGED